MPVDYAHVRRRQPENGTQASPFWRKRGLGCLLLPEGSGRIRDMLRPTSNITYSSMTGGTRLNGGRVLSNTSTGTGNAKVPALAQGQRFSRVAHIFINGLSTGTIAYSATSSGTGGAQWRIESSGELLLLKANVIGVGASSGAGLAGGKTYMVGMTYDGTTVRHYVDGRYVGGASSAQTFTVDTDGYLFTRLAEGFNGELFAYADFPNVILTDREMKSLTRNIYQLWYRPVEGPSATSTAAALQALLTGASTATPSLSTSIAMAMSTVSQASAVFGLSTSIPLASSMGAVASETAALTTSVALGASWTGFATLTPSLGAGAAALAAAISASAATTASLTTAVRLAMSASAQASIDASLAGSAAQLAATWQSAPSLTSALSTQIAAAMTVGAVATVAADLSAGSVPMAASATGSAALAGALSTAIRLAGALQGAATFSGSFGVADVVFEDTVFVAMSPIELVLRASRQEYFVGVPGVSVVVTSPVQEWNVQ